MKDVPFPFLGVWKDTQTGKWRVGCKKYYLIRLFPILFALIIMWGMCALFTATNVLEGKARTGFVTNSISFCFQT